MGTVSYGDVRDDLIALPHYAGNGYATLSAGGLPLFPVRSALADIVRPRRIFEFGALHGYCLVSFLAGAPEVQAVGWVDCERDSPGSNWGCRENVESFLYSHGRSAEIRYWSWSWESLAFGQADLVQVDGEHSYDSCMLDLIFAYRLSPPARTAA